MASPGTTNPATCTHCHAALASPIVCTQCQTLIPVPHEASYFDLLGLERTFAQDDARLAGAFRAISRKIHPDRFAQGTTDTRLLATRLSAAVNHAYEVLKNPVRRAGYLLELAGGPDGSETRDVPGNLLAEVMIWRESMEEATSAGNRNALIEIRNSVLTCQQQTMDQLKAGADSLDQADDTAKSKFRQLLNSIKYFDNLLDELDVNSLTSGATQPS